jgi:hypothetical protein
MWAPVSGKYKTFALITENRQAVLSTLAVFISAKPLIIESLKTLITGH